MHHDLVIIGGGAAGLAAAIEAKRQGIGKILIIEKEKYLGGVLNQCIHSGFGESIFDEELTGPEYAQRFIDEINKLGIDCKTNTMVLQLNNNKTLTAVNQEQGILDIEAKAVILAMGCREKPRGVANIAGSGCAGVFTAGTVQRFINLDGAMPGKEIVILGSGDLGLIMARRLCIEGAEVRAVIEIKPYCVGLKRNLVKCLKPFNIPMKLSHTIIDVVGKERVEGVVVCKVDNKGKIMEGSEEYIPCDTLILSVGLLPENELSRKANIDICKDTNGPMVDESLQTNVSGIFACGNVLHVQDYIETITREGFFAGRSAALYIKDELNDSPKNVEVVCGDGISYVLPNRIAIENVKDFVDFRFRVEKEYSNANIAVYFDGVREICEMRDYLTPSLMEIMSIEKEKFEKYKVCKSIIIKIEQA